MTKTTDNKPAVATATNQPLTVKTLFAKDEVKKKFEDMMGKRATSFITSILQIVSSNDLLKNADPMSIYNSAAVAATLDLPLNQNLGFAYIIGYNQTFTDENGQRKQKQVAQFQMGYKGFIQLAQRSGLYKTINTTDVREGEIKSHDRMTGELQIEWNQTKERNTLPIVGYMCYFELLNGFRKSLYMTNEELNAHGVKYSQSFKKNFGLWKDNFEAMATKTVTKLLISKYGPLSVDMQKAVVTDQGIIKDEDANEIDYVDAQHTDVSGNVDKEEERITLMLQDATTIDDLEMIQPHLTTDEQIKMFEEKREQINLKGGNKK